MNSTQKGRVKIIVGIEKELQHLRRELRIMYNEEHNHCAKIAIHSAHDGLTKAICKLQALPLCYTAGNVK